MWICSRTKCRPGGCKEDEVTEGNRILHNDGLHDFNCSRIIIRRNNIKKDKMGAACSRNGCNVN